VGYCTGTPAAAVPSAAKPPTVGKKLLTPVAKATSASNPSAAPTPVKASAKVPAKKAAPTAAEGAPTGEGPAAKGKGKGKVGDAEKAPKAPRAKNAYMFFMADKRDAVKGEHSIMLPCQACCSNLASCTKWPQFASFNQAVDPATRQHSVMKLLMSPIC